MVRHIESCVKGLAVALVMALSSSMALAQEERREVMLETSLGSVMLPL